MKYGFQLDLCLPNAQGLPLFAMAKLIVMVWESPLTHYFFFAPRALRDIHIGAQKRSGSTYFVIRQIKALGPLINMAYKIFFNGSVLGRNLREFPCLDRSNNL